MIRLYHLQQTCVNYVVCYGFWLYQKRGTPAILASNEINEFDSFSPAETGKLF